MQEHLAHTLQSAYRGTSGGVFFRFADASASRDFGETTGTKNDVA
jgi:hypothetical protein